MEFTIHPYQRIILKKLMYNPKLRFSELQIQDMTSKHFNYHLKQLKEMKLIEKIGNNYNLTTEGKKYVAMVDEANMKLEQQPKVSIVVFPERINSKGQIEILLSKRLKHPNYGKVVGIGGKVRFGETFEEAAIRELKEETGLSGESQMSGIIRKIGFQSDDKQNAHDVVLDIVFILFHVTNIKGKFIEQNPDQLNIWCELKAIPSRKDISDTVPYFLERGLKGSIENFELITKMEGY